MGTIYTLAHCIALETKNIAQKKKFFLGTNEFVHFQKAHFFYVQLPALDYIQWLAKKTGRFNISNQKISCGFYTCRDTNFFLDDMEDLEIFP